jgi:hypothetical protein
MRGEKNLVADSSDYSFGFHIAKQLGSRPSTVEMGKENLRVFLKVIVAR